MSESGSFVGRPGLLGSFADRLGLFDKKIDRATFARAIAVCAGFLAGLAAAQLDDLAPLGNRNNFQFWFALAAIICLFVVYHILAHTSDSREEIASFSMYAGIASLVGAAIGYILDFARFFVADIYSDVILLFILLLPTTIIIHSTRANLKYENVSLRRTATMAAAVSAAELSAVIGALIETGYIRIFGTIITQFLVK